MVSTILLNCVTREWEGIGNAYFDCQVTMAVLFLLTELLVCHFVTH